MWFFLKRTNKPETDQSFTPRLSPAPATKAVNYADMIAGMGDFGDLATEDVALKFWLPDPVERALEDLAKYYEVSVSLLVRILLADYVYGRYALAYMRENQVGIHRREPDSPMFSRKTSSQQEEIIYKKLIYKVPELGKNIAPIKVWIAQRMKDDLQALADHAGVLLSKFVRELIVGGVLGRGTLPERPGLAAVQPMPTAEAWEQGQDVPMREVDRAEIGELIDYEVGTA
jgi:hypothetical protein